MEYIPLKLNIISAEDLKDVNHFTSMKVYATVSVFGDPGHPQADKTPVHKHCGTNPTWNHPVKFTVNESLVQQNRLYLEIKLISDRILAGDTPIGTVHIPLKELLDNPAAGDSLRQVSYPVREPSGKAKGTLNISYKLGERVMPFTPPGTAYGDYPPAQPVYGYPPQPGHGYPPQQGSGYPPPQQGYGHPAGQKPPKKKNKLGMGLGAGVGLVADALNIGMAIEKMGSVVGTSDAGYDAEFDDARSDF